MMLIFLPVFLAVLGQLTASSAQTARAVTTPNWGEPGALDVILQQASMENGPVTITFEGITMVFP